MFTLLYIYLHLLHRKSADLYTINVNEGCWEQGHFRHYVKTFNEQRPLCKSIQ